MQFIDLQAQTIYADLMSSCSKPVFDGRGLSFTKKNIKGNEYWYLNMRLGQTAIQKYLGPCNEEIELIIHKEKDFWVHGEDERKHRARLVDMYLSSGVVGLTINEGKVLSLLERTGVFLSGGVLVGTPAFRAIGNNLGVSWADDYRTKDLDIAADHRFPVALKNSTINISELLLSKEVGALEVPALNPKNPSTQYKLRNQQYIIDVLAPELGKPTGKPIFISQFNTYATPLRFLDYLLQEIEPAVMPYGVGILVNVPNPARFALHKLVVSQRRNGVEQIKSQKDIKQASQVLKVLFDSRPGAVLAAYAAAEVVGGKFMKQLELALKLLPEDVQDSWSKWIK